jgi:hypothetical protein
LDSTQTRTAGPQAGAEIEARREAFHPQMAPQASRRADSLEEAGERVFAFTRLR